MRFSYAASTLALILIVGIRALAVAQPMMGQSPWNQLNGMGPWHMGPGMMMGAAPRHQLAMMPGIPEPYRSMSNPLPRSADTVEFGALVYHQNCASCHGVTGRGDGLAARELSPRPANLAWLSRMPMVEWDPFMYWTIAEGGAPLGTAMPPFKDVMAKDDISSVIAYIQAQLPPATKQK
jgi:mono/diheme cytochrome c family protein